MDAPRVRHDRARQTCRTTRLKREALSLETPDGKTIPLASINEYREGNTARAAEPGEGPARLDQLLSAKCEPGLPLGFFSDLDSRAMAVDEVELSDQRACLGRLYFQVPGASRMASTGST